MSIRSRYQQTLNEVTNLRDSARLQAHLFSLDIRDRWDEVEEALNAARFEAQKEGEEAAELALSTLEKAAELGRHLLHQRNEDSRVLKGAAKELMSATVNSCSPQDTLNRASQVMWETNCGSIPVQGEDRALVGIITDRDVCMASYLKGLALGSIAVGDAMSRNVVTAGEESTIGEVLGILATHQLRRVPIVDAQNRILGIITLADLARHIAGTEDAPACRSLARTLAAISAPPS